MTTVDFSRREEAAPDSGRARGAATRICEECFEVAMRATSDAVTFVSQYTLRHTVRHGGTQAAPVQPDRPEVLSELDERVLRFERYWWRRPGSKLQAIADTFGLTQISYFRYLNSLLSVPAAMAFDPPLVNRLLRQRDEAARLRLAMR